MTINVPQAQPHVAERIWVYTADFGRLSHYLDIPPGRIHAEAPSVLFQVPESRTSVLSKRQDVEVTTSIDDVETGTPVAFVAIRLGKQFIAAAFNPLEPQTRAAMRHLRQLCELPIAIEFDFDAAKPTMRQNFALLSLDCDAFGMALDATEGMPPVSYDTWLPDLSRRVVRALPSLGLRFEELSVLHVHAFAVLPAGPWPVVREEATRADVYA